MHFLITGVGGSIGYRHYQNIVSLGHTCCGIEPDISKHIKFKDVKIYMTKEEVFLDNIDAVVICSPTSEHINDAIFFATKNKHIFIEKPLSYNMDGVNTFVNICREQSIKLMTACNLRFNNGIRLVSILLNNKSIGKPLSCQYYFGHDLRQWHPDRDYTKSYSASYTGGILNDDIHALDLLIYLFGLPVDIKGILYKSGILNIEQEDIASYVIKFDSGVIGSIVSDYLSPSYLRNMQIIGEHGIIHWSFDEGYVNLKTKNIDSWRTFNTSEPTNEMYIREMSYFIECIQKDIKPFSDGIEPLKWILKLKEKNR